MYDSDRGIEEMLTRLAPEDGEMSAVTVGDGVLSVEWLAEQMRVFVDLHPDWEDAIGRFASQLARSDDSD